MLPSAFQLRSVATFLERYGLSVVLSGVALVLMVLLRPLMEHSIFFLFLAAVVISALYGGLGPGLVATVLSTMACDLFFLPPDGVPISGLEEALRLTIFLSTGVIISWLAEAHKRAEDRLRRRNEDLERWIAKRKALEEQLEHRASHDYLTDLHNQASFYEHLGRALSRARRQGSKVAMLFIDLDDFKLINDYLGHQEGDRLLREVAERLKKLRIPFDVHDEYWMYISASIGIAVGAQGQPQELVRAADVATYQAKRMGKARSVVFSPNTTTGNAF